MSLIVHVLAFHFRVPQKCEHNPFSNFVLWALHTPPGLLRSWTRRPLAHKLFHYRLNMGFIQPSRLTHRHVKYYRIYLHRQTSQGWCCELTHFPSRDIDSKVLRDPASFASAHTKSSYSLWGEMAVKLEDDTFKAEYVLSISYHNNHPVKIYGYIW